MRSFSSATFCFAAPSAKHPRLLLFSLRFAKPIIWLVGDNPTADSQNKFEMDQAKTSAMTSSEQSLPPVRRCTKTEFRAWLARAKPGEQIEYHLGLLIWDRSPASGLAEGDRRALGKIADAVFQAAGQGQVHLVQRRHGPFDFSYLAIKSIRPTNRRAVATLATGHAAAQRSTVCSEAA